MKYIELKTLIPKDIADNFTEFLDEIKVEGYYEVLFDSTLPKPKDGTIIRDDTQINIYLGEEDKEKELKIFIFLKTKADSSFFIESRLVETREFEDAYKEFYKPFQIGISFCIIPVWEKDSAEAKQFIDKGLIPLFMNPGMAFGTGHHETTKLMLTRMPDVIQNPGMKVLDMGVGSGILSIGAGLLGASSIVSVDIDPNAIRAAEYNWSQNSKLSNVNFELLEGGFDTPKIFEREFDLMLANITYAVISQNIHLIKKIHVKKFLFSGIISERYEDSLKLFKDNLIGELLFRATLDGWEVIEWGF